MQLEQAYTKGAERLQCDFVFCAILLIANVKILVHSFQWSAGNGGLVLGSILAYVLAFIIVSFAMPTFDHFGNF